MSNPSPHVIVVGSHAPGLFIKVKDIPRAGETVIGWNFYEAKDGGKGSNQAIAVARLGVKTSFVGCVGNDRIGQEIMEWMMEEGIDIRYLNRLENSSSGIGFIILNDEGVPAMVTSLGANGEITHKMVDDALEANQNASVMMTQFEIPPGIAIYAAKVARRLGMISIINPAPAPDEPIEDLNAASILLPNETEAKKLLGLNPNTEMDALQMAVEIKNKYRPDCVIITLGENGATGVEKSGKTWSIPSPKVDAIDTSGAGDAFCAGLAVALAEGKEIHDAAIWASYAAALSVSRPGTIPAFPRKEEVNDFYYKTRHTAF